MKPYIVKPLEISETKSMKAIAERLKGKKKVYIISGAEKVGKTAFAIKLLYTLMKEQPKELRAIVISLDNSVKYWQNFFQVKAEIFSYPFKESGLRTFENSLWTLGIIRINLLVSSCYNFIVIDGIDRCKAVLDEADYEKLFNYVVSLAKSREANYFITCRTNQLSLSHPELVQSVKDGFVELWNLERPDYLGKDIKEFGETRLKIE